MPDNVQLVDSEDIFSLIADTVIAKLKAADIRASLEGPYAVMLPAALRPHYTSRLKSADYEAAQLEEGLRTIALPDQWAIYRRELENRLARAGLPA